MGRKKKRKGLTLSKFFKNQFTTLWINGKQLDGKTHSSYCESIAWWDELVGKVAIKDVDDMTAATFIAELGKQKGKKSDMMARSSIAKHCRQLQTIFKLAGPRTHDFPQGLELIDRVPYFPIPKLEKDPPGADWTIEEIRAMYDATDCMTSPRLPDVLPADWWKCLLCVGYFTGFRIHVLTHIEYSMLHGKSIRVPSAISKGGKGISQYLHSEALEHIERIRRPGRNLILEWPKWDKGKRMAYVAFEKLLEAAGIAQNRRWKFHSLRKTHLTILATFAAGNEQSMRIAQQSAGHSSIALTKNVYIAGGLQQRLVANAIDLMPSPCGKAAAARESNSKE